jgi:RNA recognition motif-containing protein
MCSNDLTKRVFFDGFQNDLNKTDLLNYFSSFGVINQITIAMDHDDFGYGFISYDTFSAVQTVIGNYNFRLKV